MASLPPPSSSPLIRYLEGLPAATLCRLWVDTRTTIAIYGQLLPLARYTIGRLLLVKGALPFDSLRSWHPPTFKSTQNAALLSLKHLQILQGRSGEVWLNEEFRISLQRALTGDLEIPGGSIDIHGVGGGRGEEQWEALLYDLVTGGQGGNVLKKGRMGHFKEVLQGAGLLSEDTSGTTITSTGFQFLLMTRHTQLWMLLMQYLSMIEASSMGSPASLDLASCIMAICRLSLMAPGVSIAGLLPEEMLGFLSDMGLVSLRDHGMMEATDLVRHLQLMPLDSNSGSMAMGHIIVETNYKVYAYTSSPLQIAILGLFVRLHDRFPNMVQGQLTGPSVQGALSKGISAIQLISYLEGHLHPTMRAAGMGLSPVIADQIHLWERDRNRLRWGEGHLYQEFMADEPFRKVAQEAQRLHSALYVNYQRRLVVVKLEAHPSIRDFIKREIQ